MKNTILILILFIFHISPAQDRLSGYLETAARNNPGLKAAFNRYRAALEQVPQVRSLPDPQLMFGYFIRPVETKSGPQEFKISLSQMFPWFGTLKAAGQSQTYRAKAAYEAFEQTKTKLFKNVRQVYYDLYWIEKQMALTEENLTILQRFQSLAQNKIAAGTASATDELRARMAVNEARNDLKKLQDRKKVLENTFRNLLHADANLTIDLPTHLDKQLLPGLAQLKLQLTENHLIKRQDFLIETYKSKQILARKTGLPKLSVGLDYINIGPGINTSGFNDAVMIRAGISIPVFRKKYKAMLTENRLLTEAGMSAKEALADDLDSRLQAAYARYEDALRRMELYRQQKALASRSTELLQSDYMAGGKNFEEILRMQRRYINYAVQYEKALSDLHKSIADIQFLLGKNDFNNPKN